jgi:hypothetical protein
VAHAVGHGVCLFPPLHGSLLCGSVIASRAARGHPVGPTHSDPARRPLGSAGRRDAGRRNPTRRRRRAARGRRVRRGPVGASRGQDSVRRRSRARRWRRGIRLASGASRRARGPRRDDGSGTRDRRDPSATLSASGRAARRECGRQRRARHWDRHRPRIRRACLRGRRRAPDSRRRPRAPAERTSGTPRAVPCGLCNDRVPPPALLSERRGRRSCCRRRPRSGRRHAEAPG